MSVGDEHLGVKLFATAALNDMTNEAVWGCLTDPPQSEYMSDMPHSWSAAEKGLPTDQPNAGRCYYCKSTCILPASFNPNIHIPTDFKCSALLESQRFKKELEDI